MSAATFTSNFYHGSDGSNSYEVEATLTQRKAKQWLLVVVIRGVKDGQTFELAPRNITIPGIRNREVAEASAMNALLEYIETYAPDSVLDATACWVVADD